MRFLTGAIAPCPGPSSPALGRPEATENPLKSPQNAPDHGETLTLAPDNQRYTESLILA
jgi:hypothetical protein